MRYLLVWLQSSLLICLSIFAIEDKFLQIIKTNYLIYINLDYTIMNQNQ